MAKESVTLTIESALLESAKNSAKEDNRSLSNYIENLIMAAVKNK